MGLKLKGDEMVFEKNEREYKSELRIEIVGDVCVLSLFKR